MAGVVSERYEGTPQSGPLSPLLANVLLDEVDRALEKRGHRFARHADDCNDICTHSHVRTHRTGERVLAGLAQAPRPTSSEGQRSQDGGCAGDRSQVPVRPMAKSGRPNQMRSGREGTGDLQTTYPGTDSPLGRAKSTGDGGTTARLCAGLESILPLGTNAGRVPRTRRVDQTLATRDAAQALAS